MNSLLKYTVQILSSDQLAEAFEFRYKAYKKSYPLAMENIRVQYETDIYDVRSIHLGLFASENGKKILAGYSRLVIPVCIEENYTHLFTKEHSYYSLHKEFNYGSETLPLLNFLPSLEAKEKVESFCNDLIKSNNSYCETSRFIIDEAHRSISLSAFFVSGMIAICHSLNISYCFFHCDPHHAAFYKKFGITVFPGLESYDVKVWGKRTVIFGSVIKALHLFQKPLSVFSDQFEKEQIITFQRAA